MAMRRSAPLLSAAAHHAAAALLSAPATTTTTITQLSTPLLRRAGLLGRRAISCPASFPGVATRTCGFSSGVLGNRATGPTHLASTGSLLATRGMSSQPPLFSPEVDKNLFSPELQKELHRVEAASEARHQEVTKLLKNLQCTMKSDHAMHKVKKANSVLEEAKVGWRIVYGSLAAAAVGIWYLLHTKSLWVRDFKIMALCYLTELLVKLQGELEEPVKKMVREEVEKNGKK